MDNLEKIYKINELLTKRFGASTAFMIITRLAEEVGELAEQVNHHEGIGIKASKLGKPSKEKLAQEALDVIKATLQLVKNYSAEAELAKAVDDSLKKFEEKYKDL